MDVAGTLVGAISLGITLCDGIATYCHAWKHQDDDVRSLTALCEALKQLLQDIEQHVKGSPILDPNIVRKLNNALQACAGHSEAVLRLTKKYEAGLATIAWKGKARELAQRLKFPFEKKTLEELKDIMIAFRGNVDTALGLLKLDLSMSTNETVQTLRADSGKNHLAIIGEIQTISRQAAQSAGAELKQKLPLLEDKLSQKIDNSKQSIENTVSQSSAAVSQSIVAEMDQRLLVLEGSVVNSIGQQIDKFRSSIDAAVSNSTAEIKYALSTHTRRQTMAFASILSEIPEGQRQYYPKTESSELSIFGPALPLSKKRRGKRDHRPVEQKFSGCKCSPNIGHISLSPSYRWGLGKESEVFVIHKRSCPLRYHSRIITKYGANIALQRLRIFGSLSISRSPYTSIFEWSISQNLTCRAVVPDDAPAFKVLEKYLTAPGFADYEHCITSCFQDLRAVFQSGQGSPHDMLTNGTTLIDRAFQLLKMNNLPNTHALWQLTGKLFELGVEMNLNEERLKLQYRSGYPVFGLPWAQFQQQIFSGYSIRFPKGPVSQFYANAKLVLEFLSWLTKRGIEIPYVSGLGSSGYENEEKPWHGFKMILNALRSDEDFSMATECGALSTAVLRRDKIAVEKALDQHPHILGAERNVFGHSPIHLAIGWRDGLKLLLAAADESLLHQDIDIMCLNSGSSGSTPLDYAIAFGCNESIQLLAEADVAFDFQWNLFVGTDSLDPDVSEVVLDIILKRLRQLLEFGKQKLPAEKFSALQITGFESFDLKARALLDCLHAEGIQLPRKFASYYKPNYSHIYRPHDFWLESGGLFHQDEICPGTAIAFFQAGFTHIDSEVEQITPLMNLSAPTYVSQHQFCFSRYFQIIEFFVEKGGRLDRQFPSKYISKTLSSNNTVNSYRVIHRIASSAWTRAIFFDFIDVAAVADLGSSRIWHDILQSNTSDPCICACASGGCRPISLALKSSAGSIGSFSSPWYHIFRDWDVNWGRILNPQHWEVAVELLYKLTLLLDGLEGEQLVEDVIRFLTFSALGLSHTCCRHWTSSPSNLDSYDGLEMIKVMDPTDVDEIRDEEVELIGRLDFLVNGFMKDFRELGLSLSQFVLEKWEEAILAELSTGYEIPKLLRVQLEEIGVKLYVDSSSGDEDESDEESDEESDLWSDAWEWKKQKDAEWMASVWENQG